MLLGDHTKPMVWLVDFSGCTFTFAWMSEEIERPVQSVVSAPGSGVEPLGQRSGSVIVLNDGTLELEIWNSDGARKPLPHVPRAASVGVIRYLAPSFGVKALPKSL